MARESILVVDDEADIRTVLVGLLRQAGYEARAAASGELALREVANERVDLVITDWVMPEMDGFALLTELGRSAPDVPVILITGQPSVERAVRAMKAGAKEFIVKPWDEFRKVRETVEHVLDAHVRGRDEPPPRSISSNDLLGSTVMDQCRANIARAAKGRAPVLLRGESGSGKGVAARAIHDQSARAGGPFVTVNCGAIPPSLIESQLFGYEAGAFTDARKRMPGLVRVAHGGTLFLDEVAELTPEMQVKLLHLLENKQVTPLGATRAEDVDVRFVYATHRDLQRMVAEGTFREDFFYRIAVIVITVPSLRERPSDVARLAARFCATSAEENGKVIDLSPGAVRALGDYRWPGNVRELRNVVERLVVFSDGDAVTAADVERELARAPVRALGAPVEGSLEHARQEVERARIREAIARSGGNKSRAARLIGVGRRTLYNKLDELGLRSEALSPPSKPPPGRSKA